jgi:hypothetical protein
MLSSPAGYGAFPVATFMRMKLGTRKSRIPSRREGPRYIEDEAALAFCLRHEMQLGGLCKNYFTGVPVQDYCNGGTFVEIVHSLNGRMVPHSGQDVAVY